MEDQNLIEKLPERIFNIISSEHYQFKDGNNFFIQANFDSEYKEKAIELYSHALKLNKNSSGETYMFCMYSFMQYSPSYELYSLRMTDTVNLPSLVSITQLPSCFLATESRICVPTPRSSSGMRRFLMPSGSGRAGLVSLMMR